MVYDQILPLLITPTLWKKCSLYGAREIAKSARRTASTSDLGKQIEVRTRKSACVGVVFL